MAQPWLRRRRRASNSNFSEASTVGTGTSIGCSTLDDAHSYVDSVITDSYSVTHTETDFDTGERMTDTVGKILCLWSSDKLGPKVVDKYLERFFASRGLSVSRGSLNGESKKRLKNVDLSDINAIVFIISPRKSGRGKSSSWWDIHVINLLKKARKASIRILAIKVPMRMRMQATSKKIVSVFPARWDLDASLFPGYDDWIDFKVKTARDIMEMKQNIWLKIKDICTPRIAASDKTRANGLGLPWRDLLATLEVVTPRIWLIKLYEQWKQSKLGAEHENSLSFEDSRGLWHEHTRLSLPVPEDDAFSLVKPQVLGSQMGRYSRKRGLTSSSLTDSILKIPSQNRRALSGSQPRYFGSASSLSSFDDDYSTEESVVDGSTEDFPLTEDLGENFQPAYNSRIFVVVAAAGMGKSVFVSQTAMLPKDLAAVIQFNAKKPTLCCIKRSIQFISRQMCENIPGFEEVLRSQLSIPHVQPPEGDQNIVFFPTISRDEAKDFSVVQLFKKYILSPATDLDRSSTRRIIFLDGLEQCRWTHLDPFLNFMRDHIDDSAPNWLRFVITTRPHGEILSRLRLSRIIHILHDDSRNISDLRDHCRNRLERFVMRNRSVCIAEILEKSQGCFYYVDWLLDVVARQRPQQDGEMTLTSVILKKIQQLTTSSIWTDDSDTNILPLRNKYSAWLEHFKQVCEGLSLGYPVLLSLLLASPSALPFVILRNATEIRLNAQNFRSINVFFTLKDMCVQFFHESFKSFMLGLNEDHPLYVDVSVGNKILADYCWKNRSFGTMLTNTDIERETNFLRKFQLIPDVEPHRKTSRDISTQPVEASAQGLEVTTDSTQVKNDSPGVSIPVAVDFLGSSAETQRLGAAGTKLGLINNEALPKSVVYQVSHDELEQIPQRQRPMRQKPKRLLVKFSKRIRNDLDYNLLSYARGKLRHRRQKTSFRAEPSLPRIKSIIPREKSRRRKLTMTSVREPVQSADDAVLAESMRQKALKKNNILLQQTQEQFEENNEVEMMQKHQPKESLAILEIDGTGEPSKTKTCTVENLNVDTGEVVPLEDESVTESLRKRSESIIEKTHRLTRNHRANNRIEEVSRVSIDTELAKLSLTEEASFERKSGLVDLSRKIFSRQGLDKSLERETINDLGILLETRNVQFSCYQRYRCETSFNRKKRSGESSSQLGSLLETKSIESASNFTTHKKDVPLLTGRDAQESFDLSDEEVDVLKSIKTYVDNNIVQLLCNSSQLDVALELLFDLEFLLQRLLSENHDADIWVENIQKIIHQQVVDDGFLRMFQETGSTYGTEETCLLVNCLVISSHVVVSDPYQLPAQLLGRLGSIDDRDRYPHLVTLLRECNSYSGFHNLHKGWWKPKSNSLPNGTQELSHIYRFTSKRRSMSKGFTCIDFDIHRPIAAIGCHSGKILVFNVETGSMMMAPLAGHTNTVYSVHFSRDGLYLLSGGRDTTVCLFSLVTGRLLRKFHGHGESVWKVRFIGNSCDQFVSCGQDGSLRQTNVLRSVVSTTNVKMISRFPLQPLAVSSDEVKLRKLAILAPDSIDDELDENDWEFIEEEVLSLETGIGDFWISSSGEVYVACDDHNLYKYKTAPDYDSDSKDSKTLEKVLEFTSHQKPLRFLSLNQAETMVVSGGDEKWIYVWESTNGSVVQRFENSGEPYCFSGFFSPDDAYIFVASNSLIRQFEVESGNIFRQFEGHSPFVLDIVRAVSLENSSKQLKLASVSEDETLRIWTPDLQPAVKQYPRALVKDESVVGPICAPIIRKITVSCSKCVVVSGHNDGILSVWSLPNGELIKRYRAGVFPVSLMAISYDDRWLAAASVPDVNTNEDSLYVYDLSANKPALRPICGDASIRCVAFSWGSEFLVYYSCDGNIRLYSLKEERVLVAMNFVGNLVMTLCWHPSDKFFLAACKTTNAVALEPLQREASAEEDQGTWVLQTKRQLQVTEGFATDSVFSDDGSFLAVCCKHRAYLWKCDSNELLRYHKALIRSDESESFLSQIVFSEDSQLVVAFCGVAGRNSRVIGWSTRTGAMEPSISVPSDLYFIGFPCHGVSSSSFSGCPVDVNFDVKTRYILPDDETVVGISTDTLPAHTKAYLLGKGENNSVIIVVEANKIYVFEYTKFS